MKHQNVILKLKMFKNYDKTVQTNPDTFIKTFSSYDIKKLFGQFQVISYDYEERQKVDIKVKKEIRGGENKEKKKKVVRKTKNKADFEEYFQKEVNSFREHTKRIKNQKLAQQNLKQNLPSNHIYIHMDFAEDFRCRSQEEIQSTYWSRTQATIHPVVAYFKREEKLCNQSFVFISHEPRHDAKFAFALLRSLVPQLTKLIS